MAATTTGAAPAHVAETTPYPWPWDGVLDAGRTAVILVEAPGAPRRGEWRDRAGTVVATLRESGASALRVSTRRAWRPGRPAPEPVEVPDDIPVDRAFEALGVDGFYGSALEPHLREAGIARLVLVGAWLETSVHSTMRTANDMGFECLLVVDACAPVDDGIVDRSVSMIEMSGGIFGAVGRTAHVLAAYAPAQQGEPQ